MADSTWMCITTEAWGGKDKYGEPQWMPRKFFRCDACRKANAVQTNYCPNCGAKMERYEAWRERVKG